MSKAEQRRFRATCNKLQEETRKGDQGRRQNGLKPNDVEWLIKLNGLLKIPTSCFRNVINNKSTTQRKNFAQKEVFRRYARDVFTSRVAISFLYDSVFPVL